MVKRVQKAVLWWFWFLVYNPISSEIYLFAYGVEIFLLRKELKKKSLKSSFVVVLVFGLYPILSEIYLFAYGVVLFDCKKYPKTWGVSDSPQTPTNEQGTPLHPSGTAYELAQVKEIENKNGLILFLIYFTQANVPQITRHLAVCRRFNFN